MERDLCARGDAHAQHASISVESSILGTMETLFQRDDPGLPQCERMLAMLRVHESELVDRYRVGTRVEYLKRRVFLRDLEFDRPALERRFGARKSEKTFGQYFAWFHERSWQVQYISEYFNALQPSDIRPQAAGLDLLLAKCEELAAQPVAQAGAQIDECRKQFSSDREMKLVWITTNPQKGLWAQCSRARVSVRCLQFALAPHIWKLRHGDWPANTQDALAEAGLPAVLMDDYHGAPLIAVHENSRIVFKSGADGATPVDGSIYIDVQK